MSNFFTSSTGEELEQSESFESSGLQKLIPEGTELLCAVVSATWEPETTYKNKTVLVLLHVLEKGQYKDFIIKDSIKVFDDKPSKADAAKTKLLAYDSMGKGLLYKHAKAGKDFEDDSATLGRALIGVEVMATFAEYDMPSSNGGDNITGNWVRKIAPKPKALQREDAHIERQAKSQPNAPVHDVNADFDDDIEF
jgi:hypothetical protein